MDIEIKSWLNDILNVISEIEEFVYSISDDLKIYQTDLKTRRAVERGFEIIGEAMNRIAKKNPSVELTDIRKVIATRHKIIHGYELVSHKVLWTIIHEDLPTLKTEVQSLLGDFEA